jgi:hypothetical protein
MESDCAKALAVIGHQDAETGLGEPRRLVEHCIKHRPEVAGRAVDGLQHLGGRGLPLQRLVALGSALGKLALQIGYEPLGIG